MLEEESAQLRAAAVDARESLTSDAAAVRPIPMLKLYCIQWTPCHSMLFPC